MVVIIRCGGGHAAVVVETIEQSYSREKIIVWDDSGKTHKLLSTYEVVTSSEEVQKICRGQIVHVYVCNGNPKVREELVEKVRDVLKDEKYDFPNAIHRQAFISPSATLGEGNYIGPFAIVNTCVSIGSFCILNSSVTVDHDCTLEDYATINPGSVLCGTVVVHRSAVLGANSSVRERSVIAPKIVVGMQAGVVKSLTRDNSTYLGVPAKLREPVHENNHTIVASTPPKSTGIIRWCPRKPFSFESFEKYLKPSILCGQLTNDGPLMPILSSKLIQATFSTKTCLLTSNGTAALHALVAAYSLKAGKILRYATQAFTFPSAMQGPLLDSIIVDSPSILENDLPVFGPSIIGLNEIAHLIDGVIVTNIFGYQMDFSPYIAWCQENGKILLVDNAASPIGKLVDGKALVDIGDGSIISLHETKPLGRGEGGAIFVSSEMAPFVHKALNFGYDIPNGIRNGHRLCSNWRMCDIAAAAICAHLDNTVLSQQFWEYYDQLLGLSLTAMEKRGLKICDSVGGTRLDDARSRGHVLLSTLFVQVPLSSEYDLDTVCKYLNSHGFEAKRYYQPLANREQAPNAWKVLDMHICLPFHMDANIENIERMLDCLLSVCNTTDKMNIDA